MLSVTTRSYRGNDITLYVPSLGIYTLVIEVKRKVKKTLLSAALMLVANFALLTNFIL